MAGKFALLIGASSFGEGGPPALAAPERDVVALQSVLSDDTIAGFRPGDVKFALNSGLVETQNLVHWLLDNRSRDDLLLLYYTGHGFKDTQEDELYLALAGTVESNPWTGSLGASVIKNRLKISRSERKLVILDCCHSGAFGGLDGQVKGVAGTAVEQDTFSPKGYGSVTLASSSPAQPSFETGGESIYTRVLVDALKTGAADPEAEEITAHALHDYLSLRVKEEAQRLGGFMEPVCYAAEMTPLVIARNPNPRKPLAKDLVDDLWSDDPKKVELAVVILGEVIAGENQRQAEEARTELINRLDGKHDLTYRVGRRIEAILKPEAPQLGPGLPEPRHSVDSDKFSPGTLFRDWLTDGSEGPFMVVLPAGQFPMGSLDSEQGHFDTEGPVHQVAINRDFAVGCYPVTVAEYDRFAGATDEVKPDHEGWGGGWRPVINVSWKDAKAYVTWLSKQTGERYRLLSEPEWEYACRAGTETRYSFGNGITKKNANYDGNKTSEVGSYLPNERGLYDMHGNVWEWVEDFYHGSYHGAPRDGSAWITGADQDTRVLRGGSWYLTPKHQRSASRFRGRSDLRYFGIGFRVARTLNR